MKQKINLESKLRHRLKDWKKFCNRLKKRAESETDPFEKTSLVTQLLTLRGAGIELEEILDSKH